MRKAGGLIAAIALLGSATVSAQDNESASGQQGITPEDDLDCALYVGALIGEDLDTNTMPPDVRMALTSSMTYFLGRYEAQRGTPINVALAQRYPTFIALDLAEIEQTCALRAQGFAARLQDVGRAVADAEAEQASDNQSSNAP